MTNCFQLFFLFTTLQTTFAQCVRLFLIFEQLERAANRIAYIQLEGFIFFASGTQILNRIKDIIELSEGLVNSEKIKGRIGEYLRLKYLVVDFEHVQSRSQDGSTTVGMDYSALRTFFEVKRIVKEANLSVIFTGVSVQLQEAFRNEGVLDSEPKYIQNRKEYQEESFYT